MTPSQTTQLTQGTPISTPGGRVLIVNDVFVPKHNHEKSRDLPARFRSLSRKVVVFDNGSIAPLQEIHRHYRIVGTTSH